jgi:hypothetical protein
VPDLLRDHRLMHGYVYEDEYAHGLYFLEWCDGGHPDRAAFLTLSLGAFGDGTRGSDRSYLCVEWRAEGMRFTDRPARENPDLLGAFIPRASALAVPNIDHLWHIADHVVIDDPRVAAVDSWLRHE